MVYPRVGGATSAAVSWPGGVIGLSPRGRGNPIRQVMEHEEYRSIPAWAGQPRRHLSVPRQSAVYPRVGGATKALRETKKAPMGLSPRGRGNQGVAGDEESAHGSIPAWAGQPGWEYVVHVPGEVYPRVGGATIVHPASWRTVVGLSPRGRGNLTRSLKAVTTSRSIPAWAGQPFTAERINDTIRVYPRVGGATTPTNPLGGTVLGLSPRGRGNPGHVQHNQATGGSIPAWAGQPSLLMGICPILKVYPRVGGATCTKFVDSDGQHGLSPRGRGNLVSHRYRKAYRRSIPAWAGQPVAYLAVPFAKWVYPRVGGATNRRASPTRSRMGLSPRGRGNRLGTSRAVHPARSIPAWAGQPLGETRNCHRNRVYPRVGGATSHVADFKDDYHGLSPRGRGNPGRPP